jgi:hypothetical protein
MLTVFYSAAPSSAHPVLPNLPLTAGATAEAVARPGRLVQLPLYSRPLVIGGVLGVPSRCEAISTVKSSGAQGSNRQPDVREPQVAP